MIKLSPSVLCGHAAMLTFLSVELRQFRSNFFSIASKSLNRHIKVDVKSYDLFFVTEWLKRNFKYLSIIQPLDFSEIFIIYFEIKSDFILQLI